MKSSWLKRVDRTKRVITAPDEDDEKEFWLARTPEERLAALEAMRQTLYGCEPYVQPESRLQRILEVVDRGTG